MPVDNNLIGKIDAVFQQQRLSRRARKLENSQQRAQRLGRLRDVILAHIDDIEQALFDDLRKTPNGGKGGEIASVLADIDTAITYLEQWMADVPVPSSAYLPDSTAHIHYEPRGTVLLLGAWNFPFALVMAPLVPIIAAGNSAMIKPNELQPATSRVIARLIAEAFDPRDVAVVEGGVAVAEHLQGLPFDHVFFTGSPAVGKRVMAAAAQHLSSVTLELGGKCPAIIGPDAELVSTAAKVVGGRFNNAGQLCLSVDHAWVPRRQIDAFSETVKALVAKMFYADGQLLLDKLPRIVNEQNFDRLLSYIEDALVRGAKQVCGGTSDRATLTIHPTVLTNVPWDARIMQEEIFGPILPLLAYDDLEQVVEQIDQHGKPLGVYVFSHDKAFIDQALQGTSSGGATINHVMMHWVEKNLPFGGVNGSGMGRYHGLAGFRELSNARSIFTQGPTPAA